MWGAKKKQKFPNSPYSNNKVMKCSGKSSSNGNFSLQHNILKNLLKSREIFITQFDFYINKILDITIQMKEQFNLYWNKYQIYKAHTMKKGHNKLQVETLFCSITKESPWHFQFHTIKFIILADLSRTQNKYGSQGLLSQVPA